MMIELFVLMFVLIVAVASLVTGMVVCIRSSAKSTNIDHIFYGDVYFEAIEDMDPYEGVDYIISYIEDPRWGCPQTHINKFLLYLAKRDDKFGQAAREKLSEMGD